ncbi:MAG: EamA family transporter [Gammaproteobacteria bacterium]
MEYFLIILVVMLTSIGQVLQKLGADRGLKNAKTFSQAVSALFQWEIILAVLCLASAVSIWLVVLYMMDVSKAFPFISLGFVVVLLSARFYLHETIPWNRWLGVVFIVAGISLLAQT